MRRLIQPGFTLVWLVAAVAACDGGDSGDAKGDGAVTAKPDGGSSSNAGSGGGGGSGGSAGSVGSRDAGPSEPSLNLPTVQPGAPVAAPQLPAGAAIKRLFSGNIALIGGAPCSHQDFSAAVDRWCAVAQQPEGSRLVELWAINVAKAAAGTVTCDGKDPSCVRVTDDLWADDITIHGFAGDTLIYYGAPASPNDIYRGTIYAWRPGWAQSQAITANNRGLQCGGNSKTAAVYCYENLAGTDAKGYSADLFVGVLGATPGVGGSLAKVENTFLVRSDGESTDEPRFSPSGDAIVYTTFASGAKDALEIVATTKTATPAKGTEIVRGAAFWQLTPDATKIYYLKDWNYGTTAEPAGAVTVADFPSGANPVVVAPRVAMYSLLGTDPVGSKSLAYIQDYKGGVGTLRLLKDRAATSTITEVAPAAAYFEPGPNGQSLAYFKNWDDIGDDTQSVTVTDLSLYKIDTGATCTFQKEPLVGLSSWQFSNTGDLFFFADLVEAKGAFAGRVVNPADCNSSKTFAEIALSFQVLPTKGFVWEEPASYVGENLRSRLRHAPLADGKTWPAANAIQTLYDRLLPGSTVGLPGGLVLFQTGTDVPDAGLYLISGL